jgi:PTS system nitrogen regulatory IIA component
MQLSVKDTARLLNVSEKTIYRWIKQQVIPAYRINEQFRFNRSELLDWAASRRIQVSPDIFRETENSKTPLPYLSEALKAGGIFYRIGGSDKPTVLRSVVDVLNLPEEVDRDFLYQVLMARESLGSTGIGDGIAIPHVRNPVVLHVSKPGMSLCFLDHPIEFGSIDGRPVSVLFTLISPTVRAHLHMLSRLSFVLQNHDFKIAIKDQAPRDALIETLTRAEAAIPVSAASEQNNRNQQSV